MIGIIRALALAAAPALGLGAGTPAARAQEAVVHTVAGEPAARSALLEGIDLLHDFAFAPARTAFRRAQAADPAFVLAWWGESMTHARPLWGEEDLAAGRAVLARLAANPAERRARARTEREARWLDAAEALWGEGDQRARYAAYRDAMRRLAAAYPDDVEAALFHALAMLGADPASEPDAATRAAAAAILERLFAANPRHPGAAHYLIHALDDPTNAHRALPAARAYEALGRTSPHALHMPAHVYLRLGLWDDALRADARAWSVSLESGAPDLHSLEWLHYASLQRGEWRRAAAHEATLARMADEPGATRARLHLERVRARAALETGDRGRAGPPAGGPFLDHHLTRANALLAFGLAAARAGDAPAVREALARLAVLREAADRNARAAWSARIAVIEGTVEGLDAFARGAHDAALALLGGAVESQAALGPPHGPPNPFAPPTEILGEVLLALGRPGEAAAAFDAVLRAHPGRAAALLGRARAALAGEHDDARDRYRRLAANGAAGDPGVPWLAEARAALAAP